MVSQRSRHCKLNAHICKILLVPLPTSSRVEEDGNTQYVIQACNRHTQVCKAKWKSVHSTRSCMGVMQIWVRPSTRSIMWVLKNIWVGTFTRSFKVVLEIWVGPHISSRLLALLWIVKDERKEEDNETFVFQFMIPSYSAPWNKQWTKVLTYIHNVYKGQWKEHFNIVYRSDTMALLISKQSNIY